MAFRIADHKLHIRYGGGKGGQLLKIRVVAQFLNAQVSSAFQITHGKLTHNPGPALQLIRLLSAGIVIAQGEECRSQ